MLGTLSLHKARFHVLTPPRSLDSRSHPTPTQRTKASCTQNAQPNMPLIGRISARTTPIEEGTVLLRCSPSRNSLLPPDRVPHLRALSLCDWRVGATKYSIQGPGVSGRAATRWSLALLIVIITTYKVRNTLRRNSVRTAQCVVDPRPESIKAYPGQCT